MELFSEDLLGHAFSEVGPFSGLVVQAPWHSSSDASLVALGSALRLAARHDRT